MENMALDDAIETLITGLLEGLKAFGDYKVLLLAFPIMWLGTLLYLWIMNRIADGRAVRESLVQGKRGVQRFGLGRNRVINIRRSNR